MKTTILPLVRAMMIEAIRRRDLAVVALFMSLLFAFLLAARWVGLETPASGTFLLNLSLTLVIGTAHLITVLVAARQFPEEIEQRTLYPLLARPVSRHHVVLGKWLASSLTGIGLLLLLTVPVLVIVPRLEFYDQRTLAQLLLLQLPALTTSAAVPIACSLLLPRSMATTLSLVIVFATNLLLRAGGGLRWFALLPNPSRLNLIVRYTDGIAPLSGTEWAALWLAGVLWTLAALLISMQRFARRVV